MQTSDYQLDTKVKKLAKSRGLTFNEVCEGVKMTPAGLRGTLEKGSSVKLELLESLCNFFEVEINYFLSNIEDNKVSSSKNPNNDTIWVNLKDSYEARILELKEGMDNMKYIINLQKQMLESKSNFRLVIVVKPAEQRMRKIIKLQTARKPIRGLKSA